jgi:small subunit ribosomal protein S18
MSEEQNNTPEIESADAVPATPAAEELQEAAPAVFSAIAAASAPPVVEIGGDDAEDDEEDGEEDGGEDGEEEGGRSGPEEYVEREKGDRRRVGSDVKIDDINYKNVPLLSRFLDRRGRIMSRRKTRVSAKVQRRIVREVKRARHLALLPYTADQTRQVRRRR